MSLDFQKQPKILIVEDDEVIRSQIRWSFLNEYKVLEARDRPTALEITDSEHPLVVILDLGLPPVPMEAYEGLKTLQQILDRDPGVKVITVTDMAEKKHAVRAIELGAYDLFHKPIIIEEIKYAVKRACYIAQLEHEGRVNQVPGGEEELEGILGASTSMQKIFQSIRKVTNKDVPVLIEGESGTGKELTARAIHKVSRRRNEPFIVINCGAIPENLLESELFGYEKGAFTGAYSRRKGRIEYAQGGTLFLDEVTEWSVGLQVKLLRFLEEHVIERLGGRKSITVDVRIIAATNRDLKHLVDNGRFREDLFYRLSVVTISVPPLRERGDDLFLLARTFLQRYSRELKKEIQGFTDEAIKGLKEYTWPGNVRELQNRIKRAILMSDEGWITPGDLEFSMKDSAIKSPQIIRLRDMRESLERQAVQQALLRHGNMINRAAGELGISRQTLSHLIRKYKLIIKGQEI